MFSVTPSPHQSLVCLLHTHVKPVSGVFLVKSRMSCLTLMSGGSLNQTSSVSVVYTVCTGSVYTSSPLRTIAVRQGTVSNKHICKYKK